MISLRTRRSTHLTWIFVAFLGIALCWLPTNYARPAHAATMIPIYAIQGRGAATPFYQQWVDTYGLVTAVVTDGFYLQDPQGDGDPATSDGIFVYTRTAPTVGAGQCVALQRTYVDEFYQKTELSRFKAITRSNTCGDRVITPVTLTPAQLTRDPLEVFEPFEGMVVELPVLEGVVQGPTVHFADGEREIALLLKSQLPYVDGARVFQAAPRAMDALIYLSNELGATLPEVRWGDTLRVGSVDDQPLRAILDYNFGKYQLLLSRAVQLTAGRLHSRLPPFAVAPPTAADDFTVCSFNLHGMGRGSEQYWDPAEYDRQLAKRARTIAEVLRGCTIIGLQETGWPEDAERLAALLATSFDLDYAVVAIPGPNSLSNEFPLTNSLLARRDRTVVVASRAPQGCSTVDYEVAIIDDQCTPLHYPLFNRPPLVVSLTVSGTWGSDGAVAAFPLTVIDNHWKSKGGDETVNVVRRTAQAAHVATLVREQLAREPDAHVIVLGDLNDYEGSGAVETLRTGVQPPLLHAFDWLPQLERYTYIYNGGSQVLDHLLITPNLAPLVARVAPLHVNADYPGGDNEQVALLQKASDHDPVLLQLRPAGAGVLGGNLGMPGLTLTLTATFAVTTPAVVDGGLAGEAPHVTTTDAVGEFRFWALTAGQYELRIDAPAHFSPSPQPGILSVAPGYQTVAAPVILPEDGRNAAALLLLAPALIQQATTQ